MTDPELQALTDRLLRGVAETVEKFQRGGVMIAIGSVVVAGLAAARGIWFLIPIGLGFGAGIWWLMQRAVRSSGPERAAPVLAALRLAPERIRSVGHKRTSDSRGIFVTHWVEIKTDDGRMFIRANEDWEDLLRRLHDRCPKAHVDRGT